MPGHSTVSSLPPWLVVLVCFPAILLAYFTLVVGGGSAIGYEYRTEHEDALYLPLVAGVAVAFYAADVVSVPVGLEPVYVAFVPLGVALYALDTYVWSWWIGKPIERGDRDPTWLLPSLLAGIGEEYLFRGVLAVLIGAVGGVAYVVASAVLFGVNHFVGGRREILLKTGNGVVYALAFLATGSLVAPVFAHVGYNAAYIGFVTGRVPMPTARG